MVRLEVFTVQKTSLQGPASFSIFLTNINNGIEKMLIIFTNSFSMGQAAALCWITSECKATSKNQSNILKKGRMKFNEDKFKVPTVGRNRHSCLWAIRS